MDYLLDRIAQATGDPGSLVKRRPDEPTSRWAARAVLHTLADVIGMPDTEIGRAAVAGPWLATLSANGGEVYASVPERVSFVHEQAARGSRPRGYDLVKRRRGAGGLWTVVVPSVDDEPSREAT